MSDKSHNRKDAIKFGRLTVNLPADLIKEIKLEAVHSDTTAGEVVRHALEARQKAKDAFIALGQELDKALPPNFDEISGTLE